jgi:hypothetical protein
MHRLRRRLREYRKGKGSEDPGWIDFPEKSYAPEFQFAGNAPALVPPLSVVPAGVSGLENSIAQAPAPLAPPTTAIPMTEYVPAAIRQRPAYRNAGLLLIVGLMALLWWAIDKRRDSEPAVAAPSADSAPVALSLPDDKSLPASGELRILAGRPGGRFVDRYGQAWFEDRYFTGGTAHPVNREVRSWGHDPNLFASLREGDFTYDIPLDNRPHELTLYFAETMYGEGNTLGGGESSRTFHVQINGKPALENFDVIADAQDPNSMTARLFRNVRPAADGKLHLSFVSTPASKAFVNAIQLRPGLDHALRPIRIVCRPQQYRDSKGNVWNADSYFRGGQQITRPSGAPVAADGDLFRGERYGRFAYAIPVTPGNYTVRLYFWEYWWGPGHPGQGGVRSRVFDVFANFKPLLESFDIIATTGKDQWAVKSFSGLRPNNEGKIALDFVPRVNNAMVNAIEVLDENAFVKNSAAKSASSPQR